MGKVKSYMKMTNAKKIIRKLSFQAAYDLAAEGSGNKTDQRAQAEQALNEWRNRKANHQRVSNLNDVLRKKY